MRFSKALMVLLVVGTYNSIFAGNVRLPAVFSNHMVVQQGKPFVVWGTTLADEAVTVELAGRKVETKSDGLGKFEVELPALDAKSDPGPHELLVSGSDTVRVSDVLVGEVWLCSGQSNMRLPLKETANGSAEIAVANFDRLRILSVPDSSDKAPRFSFDSKWQICSSKSVAGFSGVAYYFGRDLQRSLNVPVGIIDSSLGWSSGEAWLPDSVLEANPVTKPLIDWQRSIAPKLDAMNQEYQQDLARWRKEKQEFSDKAKADPVAAAKLPPMEPRPRKTWGIDMRNRPEEPFNAMLAPLIPFSLGGVCWYQGETNAVRAEQYQTMLPMLIDYWRKAFRRPDLPFGIVQLPNHVNRELDYDTSWAELREAQLMTYRKVEHTGLIVTLDVGDSYNIHPTNKKDVGGRLALWALSEVYARPCEWTGPLYKSSTITGNAVRIQFDHIGKGLTAKNGELAGFTIAGKDGVFSTAAAKIEGDEVVVSSPTVAEPASVRYAFSDNPKGANLFNADGFPASSFRTDNWPGKTAGVLHMEWLQW